MLNSQILKEKKTTEDLQPGQALDLINKNNHELVILDVCTEKEFKERHLKGAENHSFISGSFRSGIESLDKTKTYLVYCTVGGRSKMATKVMKKAGFQTVYNLIGGTLLWEEFEYPFAKNANKLHGFSICPILNSVLVVKKARRLLSSVYDKLLGAIELTQIKKRMAEFCSDLEADFKCGSRCKNMMPMAMEGCCSAMVNKNEVTKTKK